MPAEPMSPAANHRDPYHQSAFSYGFNDKNRLRQETHYQQTCQSRGKEDPFPLSEKVKMIIHQHSHVEIGELSEDLTSENSKDFFSCRVVNMVKQ